MRHRVSAAAITKLAHRKEDILSPGVMYLVFSFKAKVEVRLDGGRRKEKRE